MCFLKGDPMQALTSIDIPGLDIFWKGKVRAVYDLGDELLIVASDRISAFDIVLPSGIPDKGKILTTLSAFWFERLENVCSHHMITSRVEEYPDTLSDYREVIRDRSMLVRKARRIDVECIVRGCLSGSAWSEYQTSGRVGDYELPLGLEYNSRLERPIFTPTTKSDDGHDRKMSIAEMMEMVGAGPSEYIMARSMALFDEASRYAETRGVTILDTKYEFGYLGDDIVLIDEVFTPDSSRFLVEDETAGDVVNLDKQYIRDYLESTGWDKHSPPPNLPESVISETRRRYLLLFEKMTGSKPLWVR
jgi:phosphoribosylaminoimidazole-succinocarboxamide synthase